MAIMESRLRTLLVAIAGALSVSPLLAGGVAYRVKDICTTPGDSWLYSAELAQLPSAALLVTWGHGVGYEPFVSDGTPAGTHLLRNLAPGEWDSNPANLARLGNRLVFEASVLGMGEEPWATDGTSAGTVLLGDLWPGFHSSVPKPLAVMNGVLYFSADDGTHGRELWRTDGTVAGTWLVRDIWRGSGSALRPGYSWSILAAVVGGKLFFAARDFTGGDELWVSDGSEAGTRRVADLVPGHLGSEPYGFRAAGGHVFFSASTPATGRELWTSDGTAAGTRLVRDLEPGTGSSYPYSLAAVGGGVFFQVWHGGQEEPWWSDGTESGTVQLAAVGIDSWSLAALGDRLLFAASDAAHGREPWTTDGTPDGTALLADLAPGATDSLRGEGFHAATGGAYFVAFESPDPGAAGGLWLTDGTVAGTRRIGDVGHYQFLDEVVETNGIALLDLFWLDDCGPAGCWGEEELWRTDGTATGTHPFRPPVTAGSDSSPRSFEARAGGVVLLAAPAGGYSADVLFHSDGTEAGTQPFTVVGGDAQPEVWGYGYGALPDGELAFAATTESTGTELWRTEGDSVALVRDIAPGEDGSTPGDFLALGDTVLFSAWAPETGDELWRTDGTPAGTELVSDLAPGPENSYPYWLTAMAGRLWFSAEELAHGGELWESDGTAAGTFVHDLTPGPDSTWPDRLVAIDPERGPLAFLSGHDLEAYLPETGALETFATSPGDFFPISAAMDGTLYYVVPNAEEDGCELWATQGTVASTVRIAPVPPGPDSSSYGANCTDWLVPLAGRLYFTACEAASGCELWTSDGTEPGTHLFLDLEPGSAPGLAWNLTRIGDRLYFWGCREATGCEPWVTDGSVGGTHLVADIAPGAPSSNPYSLTASGRLIYFGADDGTGTELWAMPLEIFYDGFETGDVSRWDPPTPP